MKIFVVVIALITWGLNGFCQDQPDSMKNDMILNFKNMLIGDWIQTGSLKESIYKIYDSARVDTDLINRLPFSPIDSKITFFPDGRFRVNDFDLRGTYEINNVQSLEDDTHKNPQWIYTIRLNTLLYYAKTAGDGSIFLGTKIGNAWGVTMTIHKL